MNRLIMVICALALWVAGCAEIDLKPTVKSLRTTIQDMRVRDYEGGRVTLSATASLDSQALFGRIERLMEAENQAATAQGEEPPHADPKAKAGEATAKAMAKKAERAAKAGAK